MNKLLITTAVALSAFSFASAQDASSTMPQALPPMVSTGDQKIDEQVRALHKEMEGKIKALREEYQKKLKALIGNRKATVASSSKAMMGSSTKEMRKEIKEERKEMRQEVRGTSTNANPQGNAWGFFRRFFGQPKPEGTITP
jgi:phenylalanyl-tRNA synthetase alpha subunit